MMCSSTTLNTKAIESTSTTTGSLPESVRRAGARRAHVHAEALVVVRVQPEHGARAAARARGARTVRLVGRLLLLAAPVRSDAYPSGAHVPHRARVAARESSELRLRQRLLRRSSLVRLHRVSTGWALDTLLRTIVDGVKNPELSPATTPLRWLGVPRGPMRGRRSPPPTIFLRAMKVDKLKVRPKKAAATTPCATEFAAMLACWASSSDIRSQGVCREQTKALQECMATRVGGTGPGKPHTDARSALVRTRQSPRSTTTLRGSPSACKEGMLGRVGRYAVETADKKARSARRPR